MDSSSDKTAFVRRGKHWFWELLKFTLGAWLRWRYRVRVVDPDGIRDWPTPYLVLANHVNFWDPFLLGLAIPHPIHHLAADGNFRSRLMRFLLAQVGAIPKIKARTDLESIRAMQYLIRSRSVVGLFPEGQRNWDGASLPIMKGTGKLATLLRAPVVAAIFHGGHLSLPRWSPHIRRGLLEIELRAVVRHHEVGRVTGREVQRRLENTLSYNELTWQRFSGVQYHCARRAEYLEMVLFQCPHCRAFGTIVSHRDTVTCTSCGNKASYTPSGRIRWFGGHDGPDTVYAWNMLQIKDLKERARLNDHPETALAWAAQVHVFRGNRLRPLLFLGEADVTVHIGGISFEWTKQARNQRWTTPLPQRFSIDTIVGIHVQMASDLEFYADGRLYLVRPTSPRTSSFWLEEALKQAQTAAKAKQSNHRSQ